LWSYLDEEDMSAGTELHRGIQAGFEESCAAVFFVTRNFKDATYLRTEVNYAKEQQTKHGERFKVITLILGKSTDTIEVPELLREFVFKMPATQLDALNEILRALPIEPGEPRWRAELK
jgi:TIR domain